MFQNKNNGQLSSKVQCLVILAWVLNTYSSLFVLAHRFSVMNHLVKNGGGGGGGGGLCVLN